MADRNGYIGRAPGDSAVQVARQDFTPTGVQTNFTFDAGYTPGYLDVYLNGSKLVVAQDFTATDGSVVGLTSAAASGDIIELVAFKAFNAASVNNAGTLTVSGNQTNNGTLSVTGGTTLSNLNVTGISTLGTVSSLDLNGGVLTLDADGDTTITADTDDQIDIAFGGNDRLTLSTGLIDLKNDGSQSAIRLYCESSNAHYAALQAPAHSAFSGNITLTLPATTDTLVARTTTDTLTNKTLTSPTISTPTLTGGVGIADSIFHTGDTNTQLRFPAADTFTVETGGSEAIRVDSSQRLLVGTNSSVVAGSTAAAMLQVEHAGGNVTGSFYCTANTTQGGTLVLGHGRGSATGVLQDDDTIGDIRFAGADGTDLQTQGANIAAEVDGTPGSNDMPGRLVFKTTADGASSPTERMRIQSDGTVKIGTGTGNPLLMLSASTSGTSVIQMGDTDDNNIGQIQYANSDDSLRFFANNAERLRITSDGDVRIGTTNAVVFGSRRALTVANGTTGAVLSLYNSTTATNNPRISSNPGGSEINDIGIHAASTNGTIQFYTNNDTERLRIDSAGRLLHGTTSSSSNTSFVLQGNSDNSASAAGIFMQRGTATPADGAELGNIYFADSAAGTGAIILGKRDGGTWSGSSKPGRIEFWTTPDGATSGNVRLTVGSDGVVTAARGAVCEIDTLTSASTVTPDFAASCNFTLTLGHNVTLANPSNLTAGQSGSIFLIQDGTGSRTITFGSNYDFAGGTAPTLSTAASSVDRLDYFVRTSSSIHCVVTLAYS